MPAFGFGNRLLYYYNLRQFSHMQKVPYHCAPWFGAEFFEGNMLGESYVSSSEILEPCLGEHFFKANGLSTREVFKLKTTVELEPASCAIHFRGTDFHTWNPESILKSEYYLSALEELKGEINEVYLFTDDRELESYKQTRRYLSDNKVRFFEGQNTPNRSYFLTDFTVMSMCDTIISSPSTFCICAGFIGKQKKIIHSNEWITNRVIQEDRFWCDLKKGGSQDYSVWKII